MSLNRTRWTLQFESLTRLSQVLVCRLSLRERALSAVGASLGSDRRCGPIHPRLAPSANSVLSRSERRHSPEAQPRWTLLCLCLCLLFNGIGCVHRRVTVRSDPPGAQVWIGERQIGYTPASFDIDWYGTEEVTLQADGFEVETQYVKIPTPWYQVPPLDFISDNFLLTRVKDQHDVTIKMRPRVASPSNELLDRGNALRSEAQLGQ